MSGDRPMFCSTPTRCDDCGRSDVRVVTYPRGPGQVYTQRLCSSCRRPTVDERLNGAIDALHVIAVQDYRGPRPPAALIADQALSPVRRLRLPRRRAGHAHMTGAGLLLGLIVNAVIAARRRDKS